jgi:hypothetical protein
LRYLPHGGSFVVLGQETLQKIDLSVLDILKKWQKLIDGDTKVDPRNDESLLRDSVARDKTQKVAAPIDDCTTRGSLINLAIRLYHLNLPFCAWKARYNTVCTRCLELCATDGG